VNLLILRALGLGDLLTAVPAIRAIARAFPMHRRVLAAPAYLEPLVRMCGGVHDLVDAAPLEPIDANLGHFDVAVNLHGRGPQSHRILLALSPKRLIAFANVEIAQTKRFPQWRADEHEIDRWCRMLSESGITADPNDLELPAPHFDARSGGAIIVHPGAASESRRWPANRWIELCLRLRRGGHRVVLTGSAHEFRRCRFIAKAAHIPIESVLAGRTDLGELACVIRSARAIVSGDTGVAHIATAVRTPSVILFGPTSPQYWGPPAARLLHRVIWRGMIGNPHAPFVDPGLASITVDEVLVELHRLLHLAQAG
jgi:ADP-heptose:LPS heptosyltransferase